MIVNANLMRWEGFWFNRKGYAQGCFWILLTCMFSLLNDVFTKYIGERLPTVEIIFFRFLFSAIFLFPLMLFHRSTRFTKYFGIHLLRIMLCTLSMFFWCYGVIHIPLTICTTIGFTTPFFVLPFAKFFLKENVVWQRWIGVFLGFIGVFLLLFSSEVDVGFNLIVLILIVSAIIFAISDIVSKILIDKNESFSFMVFFQSAGCAVLTIFPTFLMWEPPTLKELFLFLLLGGGANLIGLCLLKAYAATDISAIQPFKYIELVLAGIFGWFVFQEFPGGNAILGMVVITFANLYIATHEIRLKQVII